MNLKQHEDKLGLGQIERHILDSINRLGKAVIRASDLENKLNYNRATSNLALSRLCKKGWLQRLQAGVYRIIPLGSESIHPIPEDAWAIAIELFSPCYISGWTAAEHWELTEQIFNSTIVLTSQKQRKNEQNIVGLKYKTKFAEEKNSFGLKNIWSSNIKIPIADIHRTIIDILDDPDIGGGGRHSMDIVKEYFQNKEANPEILYQYAEKLDHGAVFKRLAVCFEKFSNSPLLLEKLHSKIKTGIINFDPHGPISGHIITKWGIRMNVPLGENS